MLLGRPTSRYSDAFAVRTMLPVTVVALGEALSFVLPVAATLQRRHEAPALLDDHFVGPPKRVSERRDEC